MGIVLEMLRVEHGEELIDFERENKAFFELTVPPRGAHHFDLKRLKMILTEIEEEQKQGLCYMYLIRNEIGELVGRINLFSIVRGPFEKAEVGYRIGQKHNGKGYAKEAVRLACIEGFETYKIHKIEAGTSVTNIGSQIVLVKNGFEFVGRSRDVIKMGETWQDGVLFEKINPAE